MSKTSHPAAVFACSVLLASSSIAQVVVTPGGDFEDRFDSFDTSRWSKADRWANGSPFLNAWRADHATNGSGRLTLRLDNQKSLGYPYSSGEVRTNGFYGYGCYQVSMKPARVSGQVTGFFTFAGPYDNGGNGRHNEIDVEFVGARSNPGLLPGGGVAVDAVQFNYYTNDDLYAQRNEYVHKLGFDAAAGFHTYTFNWTSAGIVWYVDNVLAHEVYNGRTPVITDSYQKIMMNLWAVDDMASGWAGTFVYPGTPLRAEFDWVRFTAGEGCDPFAPPPVTPPPPPPGSNYSYLAGLNLSLAARGTQVVARARLADATGVAVANLGVTGTWSGVITTGDNSRTTDSTGTAVFYSSRNSTKGQVTFCVTGVTGSPAYDLTKNVVGTCSSINK